jgi:hypothetical protein
VRVASGGRLESKIISIRFPTTLGYAGKDQPLAEALDGCAVGCWIEPGLGGRDKLVVTPIVAELLLGLLR